MSQDKIRLLEHLVYSQFGDAVGEITSILLNRGSLSFEHIRRLSSLPSKTIHASLAVLSLHSLIYHSDPGDPLTNDKYKATIELFEMNEKAIEERMRLGKYSNLAEKWLIELSQLVEKEAVITKSYLRGLSSGRGMGLVVKLLMMEGFVNEKELIEVLVNELRFSGVEVLTSPKKPSKGKGKAVASNTSEDSIDAAYRDIAKNILMRALESNIISVVTPGSQLSPSSLEIKWLDSARRQIKGVPSSKELTTMKLQVIEMKEQFAEDQRYLGAGLDLSDRREGASGPPKKKIKMANVGEEVVLEGTALPRAAFYRINSEKLHIRWRNELMCEFVHDRYNPIIAAVFGVILSIAEPMMSTLDERVSKPINSRDILAKVETLDINLKHCYAPPPQAEKNIPAGDWKVPSDTLGILHEICNDLADRRDDEAPMESPLGQSKEFLSAVGSGGAQGMRWRVEFGQCGARMKRMLVESMVFDKVGTVGVRCWRIIDGKGKLDEKHLATLALLSVKESRETLAHLSTYSLISCQEVPRSADRAPSRTFFLWYVDYPKVIQTLLDHQFKALANLQSQRTFQLEKRSTLVAKRERSDVISGGEEHLLTKMERDGLDELDRILEALATAEQRIDRDIFVLRDMDP